MFDISLIFAVIFYGGGGVGLSALVAICFVAAVDENDKGAAGAFQCSLWMLMSFPGGWVVNTFCEKNLGFEVFTGSHPLATLADVGIFIACVIASVALGYLYMFAGMTMTIIVKLIARDCRQAWLCRRQKLVS